MPTGKNTGKHHLAVTQVLREQVEKKMKGVQHVNSYLQNDPLPSLGLMS